MRRKKVIHVTSQYFESVDICRQEKQMIKSFISSNKFAFFGTAIGLLAGYLYYQQIGCVDGCTITGDPLNSSLYGALMGGVALSMLDAKKKAK